MCEHGFHPLLVSPGGVVCLDIASHLASVAQERRGRNKLEGVLGDVFADGCGFGVTRVVTSDGCGEGDDASIDVGAKLSSHALGVR